MSDSWLPALAAVCAGVAVGLALPLRHSTLSSPGEGAREAETGAGPPDEGVGVPVRIGASGTAALVAAAVVGGLPGVAAGMFAGWRIWTALGRLESRATRRERDRAVADLPILVGLVAAALRAGAPVDGALFRAGHALPGAAADRLLPVVARLRLGVQPEVVWSDLAADEVLAPLGRGLARAQRTGAPVASTIDAVADELLDRARSEVEDRARAVGVRAALPLGLCLLPGFLLLGIVPLVAALLAGLVW